MTKTEPMTDSIDLDAERVGRGCMLAEGRHYEVFSTQFCIHPAALYENPEPAEWGCAYAEVVAKNGNEAKWKACKTRDFVEWVDMQRGDDKIPVSGLTARLFQCEHGTCWACCDEGCTVCLAEDKARYEAEEASWAPLPFDGST